MYCQCSILYLNLFVIIFYSLLGTTHSFTVIKIVWNPGKKNQLSTLQVKHLNTSHYNITHEEL